MHLAFIGSRCLCRTFNATGLEGLVLGPIDASHRPLPIAVHNILVTYNLADQIRGFLAFDNDSTAAERTETTALGSGLSAG